MEDAWGIADGYWDVVGTWHETSDETRELIRAAMGDPDPGRGPWFVLQGSHERLLSPCDVVLEDGTVLHAVTELPPDLPLGYHELRPVDGTRPTTLIVHPPSCPELPVAWGLAVQTYALWSDRSWGVGDLRDLARLCAVLADRGGRAVLISPLHQPAPTHPIEPSPYYPSTRRAWNPLLLAMEDPPPEHLVMDPSRIIDRDDVWEAKRAALLAQYVDDPTIHPGPISRWNARAELLATGVDPDAAPDEVARAARFHEWLQERVGEQLSVVTETGIALIGDLAVGFSPDGADADEFRDVLALDMRLGAPPDPFNEEGQDWGIPPFVPAKLRAAGYRPFIDTVRAALRGVQGLRIDHVMGLFRQYWVPLGGEAADGAYVRFPADDLLAIICLEATRAGAFVVGEDLGTVEKGVPEVLAARGVASTKVLWFEDEPPAEWPEHALATITTHDLPTLAGVFQGEDGEDEMRDRLEAVAPSAMRAGDAAAAAHAALLDAPSRLRLVTADDLAGASRRPNLPGLNDYPSWRIPLPVPVDELARRIEPHA